MPCSPSLFNREYPLKCLLENYIRITNIETGETQLLTPYQSHQFINTIASFSDRSLYVIQLIKMTKEEFESFNIIKT